jgi:hypothetical protein
MNHDYEVEIRRDFLLEDAFKMLYPKQEGIKDSLSITFIDEN